MKTMTKEEMRQAIAEKCGFTFHPKIAEENKSRSHDCQHREWTKPLNDGWCDCPPNYPEDLNACSQMEQVLVDDERRDVWDFTKYGEELLKIVLKTIAKEKQTHGGWCGACGNWKFLIKATPLQRCEAFCRVFWPERFE